jgi:hypothetical protein
MEVDMLNDKIVQEKGGKDYILEKMKRAFDEHNLIERKVRTEPEKIKNLSQAKLSLISYSKELALSHLLLGEYKEAKRWFRVMAQHIEEYSFNDWQNILGNVDEYFIKLDNIRWLLLSGQEEILKKVAQLYVEYKKDPKEYEFMFNHLYCWIYIILNQPKKALSFAERYVELEKKSWKGYYQGIAPASLGIIKQDQQLFNQGIQRILEIFPRKRAQKKYELWAPICEEAVALMLMAKDNNLEIDYSNPYTPSFFFENLGD